MEGSAGKALRDARLKKNLTVEEVARSTKMRADRISDLERDDYTRFPNLAYARSFLLLYAKYLGVDISKYPTLEVGSAVGLGDYQYLQGGEAASPRPRHETDLPPEKPRWLIFFLVFLAMLALGALIGWFFLTFQRIGPLDQKDATAPNISAPAASPTPVQTPTATPAPTATATSAALAAPSPNSAAVPAASPMVLPAQPVSETVPATPEPEVRRAEPLTSGSSDAAILAEAAAAAAAVPVTPPAGVFPPKGAVREIKIRATRKTKVRIVRDVPQSPSLYYGPINPAMRPLTFSGKYFWIRASDPTAVQITIDGQPVAGPDAGVEILQSSGL